MGHLNDIVSLLSATLHLKTENYIALIIIIMPIINSFIYM